MYNLSEVQSRTARVGIWKRKSLMQRRIEVGGTDPRSSLLVFQLQLLRLSLWWISGNLLFFSFVLIIWIVGA